MQKGFSKFIKKIKIKELSEKDLKPIVDDLINLMIENEIGHESAEIIGKELIVQLISIEHTRFKTAKPLVREALRNSIAKILEVDESRQVHLFDMIEEAKSEGRPFIICILGINGTGKTTTIAKLTKLFQNKNYSVVLAAGDTYRSGSIQQLGKHADNLGVRMIAHDYGGDPAAVAIDAIDHAEAKNIDIVLIDTAGRMQNNINLIRELEKIIRLSEPDLRIFIGDSLAGNDVIRQVKQFDKDVGIDGIIMTKVDADVKGGAVITVAHAANRPVLYVGNGQGYDHLVEFDPNLIVNQVIPN